MKKSLLFSLCLCTMIGSYASNPGDIITLNLSQPSNPSEFTFKEGSGEWTETYNDADYTFIESQIFMLSHLIAGEGSSWGGYYWDGFTVCSNGDNENYGAPGSSSGWTQNQWGCMAGGGIETDADGNILKDENGIVKVKKGNPYLVGYWSTMSAAGGSNQIMFNDGNEYEAVGIYVNAHPWPYYGCLGGDGFARAFDQEGDEFVLTATGLDSEGKTTGKADYTIAKFADGALTQSQNWEYLDLSPLGKISQINFSMTSTDSGAYGMNTAAYFCADKLSVRVPLVTSVETELIDQSRIKYNASTMIINADSTIEVYTVNGQLVAKDNSGEVNISMLPSGIYIAKSGNKTIKISK